MNRTKALNSLLLPETFDFLLINQRRPQAQKKPSQIIEAVSLYVCIAI